jgi:hypothetical protein
VPARKWFKGFWIGSRQKPDERPYDREDDLITGPRPHEAQAALTFLQLAFSRAKIALDAAVGEGVPIAAGDSVTCVGVFHRMKIGRSQVESTGPGFARDSEVIALRSSTTAPGQA